ncbi:hypothetical protein QWZ13_03010 [Reinekea marina]|uniref:hypothetical protein n=1 Tax=Reinekea marina TaxID=1310421 RepID=UPI0025B3652F|nr:hypothetical protein [Reinekea marina]MDN3647880.1 hypothetical protein [Reinekea marina]
MAKQDWGEERCYEEWMGGNLENFLYFRGLLVGFRVECTDHPTENSQVCMFQVKIVNPIRLFGKEISRVSKAEIEDLLLSNNLKYRELPNGTLQCKDRKLQFHFNDGNLDEVYFAG